jgi:membrane protease YdiL (CAAX protease family)
MRETLFELFAYIKNPVLEKDENTNFTYRLKTFFSLFLISLLTAFIFTISISLVEESGFISTRKHAIESLFEKATPVYFFVLAVIIAPLVEESIFRAPLTLFKK